MALNNTEVDLLKAVAAGLYAQAKLGVKIKYADQLNHQIQQALPTDATDEERFDVQQKMLNLGAQAEVSLPDA